MNEANPNEQSMPFPAPWDRVFIVSTRILVWLGLFGILYLLRSFFLLLFLTFVFSYIQAHGVHLLEPLVVNRPLRVVLVSLVLVGILIAIIFYLFPRVKSQAVVFVDRFPVYMQNFDEGLKTLRKKYPLLETAIPSFDEELLSESPPASHSSAWDPKTSPSAYLLHQAFGVEHNSEGISDIKRPLKLLQNIGQYVLAFVSAFLLSLLFSFLIVLDLPRLTRSVRSLGETKLKLVYEEVADSIKNFGKVLGRALEAQLIIAMVNTLLTASLLQLLGFGAKLAFLSVIVFLCSFIPVAGVFISSVPICLVALEQMGIHGIFIAALLIWIIHLVEAYVLNPRIYGHHLRMNPVLVLIILTIGGKLFHVWGLVLGVPICTYVFSHAIQFHEEE